MTLSMRKSVVPAWLWVSWLIYGAVHSALSILKHSTFHSYNLDLGIFLQVIWNTAQGRFFEVSVDSFKRMALIGNYLGNHVRPIFFPLALLYRLWPDPSVLFILQSIALGLGAIPLFWIAQRELRNKWLQVGLVVVYFLYPALGFINLFDFHPVAFCVPALLLAYWALQERQPVLFWSMILLSLATKEELVVPVAAFGIYCLFRPQWRKIGVWLLVISAVWAFFCFAVIVPYYNEGRPYRFFDAWYYLMPWHSQGTGGDGMARLSDLFSIDAAYFVLHLFLPLGFLFVLEPGLLAVSLPSLGYLLLSSRVNFHRVGHQYPAVLIPWLFLATVYGLAKLERWPRMRPKMGRWLPLVLLLVGTLGANLKFNPLYFHWRSGDFEFPPYYAQVNEAMAQIPRDAGVATINAFGPHLIHRRYLISLDKYALPLNQDHLQYVDYVLLDLVDCRGSEASRTRYAEIVRQTIDTGQFGVQYWSGRILLLKRGAPVESELDEVRAYVDRLEEEGRPCWP